MAFLSHKTSGAHALTDRRDARAASGAVRAVVGGLTLAADFAMIVAASFASALLYDSVTHSGADTSRSLTTGLATAVFFSTLAWRRGQYQLPALIAVAPERILSKWLVSLALLVATAFLLKVGASFSRGTTVIFGLLGFVALLSSRTVAASILRRTLDSQRLQPTKVIVIGECCEIDPELDRRLAADPSLQVVGFLPIDSVTSANGAVQEALNLSSAGRIDQVLISLPWARFPEIEQTVQGLRQQALPVVLLPEPASLPYISRPTEIAAIPAFELKRAALSASERFWKRGTDILVAGLALLALSPVMLLAALAIRMDSPGPVLFRQRRCGFNNREFSIFKFRTMRVMEDGPRIAQATKGDARITTVGRFLRRTSIDELPQLFNVILGDMSVVGPRPHALSHDREWAGMVAGYARRHNIKPGMTGLAQVSGFRGEVDTPEKIRERVRHDLQYIESWSLSLDFRIMLKTAIVLFFQKEAV